MRILITKKLRQDINMFLHVTALFKLFLYFSKFSFGYIFNNLAILEKFISKSS